MDLYHVTLFDGVCDQTNELQALYFSMPNNGKWIISSSGHYMFVRFAVQSWGINIGFNAKIHYGKLIPWKKIGIFFSVYIIISYLRP